MTSITGCGNADDKTYWAWNNMRQRCRNSNNPSYKDYGGRGIRYDPSWEKYKNFLADMGEAPRGYCLDRIDNNQGYFKENCRWTTRTVSARNRRPRINGPGYNGVHKEGKKWLASIWTGSETIRLGVYTSLKDAITARKEGEKLYW